MRRRMHPARMNHVRRRAFRYVLRDLREARSGNPRAILQRRFAWKLVRQRISLRHKLRVVARCVCQRIVPTQLRQALRGALAVRRVKQRALRGSRLRRCIHDDQVRGQHDSNQQSNGEQSRRANVDRLRGNARASRKRACYWKRVWH